MSDLITVSEVKTFLEITDPAHDNLLQALVTSVNDFIIRRINNYAVPGFYQAGYNVVFDKAAKTITLDDPAITYGFVYQGFADGNSILIKGSHQNDGIYTIASLTESQITIEEDTLTNETNINRTVIQRVKFTEDVKLAASEYIASKMDINKTRGISSYSLGDYSETRKMQSEMQDIFRPYKKMQWI